MQKHTAFLGIVLTALPMAAQTAIPEWCRALPRQEYKSLARVQVSDP
jgi:hypothetical protein